MAPNQPQRVPVDSVPLLDVGRGNRQLNDEIQSAIQDVCASGRFLHGPDCRALEESVAELCQAKHGVGCASGSDALLLSLMAVGVGSGDEVIVPSFTFFATASSVWRLGATPVFVDIEPDSMNLDPTDVLRAITPATKAIIPVHLFGRCANMEALSEIGQAHQLTIIEDAAQAIGASFQDRPAGAWGAMACFSFYPTKNLGGFGDGGMLTTNDDQLAERLRLLSSHGMRPRYYHSEVGINSRLDTIQAAVLRVKLKHLAEATRRRRENAQRYTELFCESNLQNSIGLPSDEAGHVWNQFTIRVPSGRRDALRQFLADRNVGSEIYYPVPLHRQQCFEGLPNVRDLPETERAAGEVLSLPIFPELTDAEQQTVVMRVQEFVAAGKLQAA